MPAHPANKLKDNSSPSRSCMAFALPHNLFLVFTILVLPKKVCLLLLDIDRSRRRKVKAVKRQAA